MRLAYTVVAGKAVQTGNRMAYAKAMHALRGLDLAQTADDATAAASGLQGMINDVTGGSAAITATFRQIQTIGGLLNDLAGIGTAIAGIAGGDANAIAVIDMVRSWIGALLNGTAPSVVAFSPEVLHGFADFCRAKPLIKSTGDLLLTGIIATLHATHNAEGALGVETFKTWFDRILDGICSLPQISAVALAASCPANASWTNGGCNCNPGFVGGPPGADGASRTCVPVPTTSTPTGGLTPEQQWVIAQRIRGATLGLRVGSVPVPALRLIPGTRFVITPCAPGDSRPACGGPANCAPGEVVDPDTAQCVPGPSGGGGGAAAIALPAVALLWYFFR